MHRQDDLFADEDRHRATGTVARLVQLRPLELARMALTRVTTNRGHVHIHA
jgi:hypothetical protein